MLSASNKAMQEALSFGTHELLHVNFDRSNLHAARSTISALTSICSEVHLFSVKSNLIKATRQRSMSALQLLLAHPAHFDEHPMCHSDSQRIFWPALTVLSLDGAIASID